jgi:ERCC4-type nuclease
MIKSNLTGRKPFYQVNIHTLVVDTNANADLDSKQLESPLEPETNNDKNEYVSVIKKVKKDNITINNIDEIMLCQIPGISVVTALALIKRFHSLNELIENIKMNEDCLKDVTYTNEKGQIRKITKTSITNLVKFLLKKNI